jgi:SPP1 gp7 family putative phage head morphogenesis protein
MTMPSVPNLLDPVALTWINSRSLLLAKSINKTTLDALRSLLSEGFAQGESIPQLSKRIEGYFTENAKYRADMISRTEVISASNRGAVDRYQKEGIQKKEWLSALDERTRETHIAANGQVVGINDDFSVGGDRMSAPGLGSDPSENINCRCTVIPYLE